MSILIKKSLRWLVALAAALCVIGSASAQTVTATITYVATSSVYLDKGAAQGVQKGDSGEVLQKGKRVATAVVLFVSDKSSSCALKDVAGTVRVGDEVSLHVTIAPQTPQAVADTAAKQVSAPPSVIAPVRKAKTAGARFTGSVGVQILGQISHDALNYNYYQPGLALRAKVENIFGAGPVLNARMNLRRNHRNLPRPGVPQTEWLSRVYEVSLSYDAPGSAINYSVGRILSNRMAGIGYLDGALLGVQVANAIEVGAFGGTQPDLRTTDLRGTVTKGGAYATYQHGSYGTQLVNATLAAAGEYYKGQISREFVYEQANYLWTDQLSAYQSVEMNVNRGWRKTANSSTLELTNLLLNVRYSPLHAVAVTASYDNRTPYRTYETRTLADSLFDTSLQQGYKLGVDMRLPWAMQADVQGGLRTRRGDNTTTQTGSAGLSTRDLLKQRVFLGARVTAFSSRFSKGYQPSITVSRLLFNRLTAGVQAGWDVYDLKTVNQKVSSNWQRINADWMMSRLLYASGSYEFYRGGGLSGNRYYAELGCRF
ncbi:MAG TPA: hypothetical protein VGL38_11740 [bacterium]|jgi:hypothetical protein